MRFQYSILPRVLFLLSLGFYSTAQQIIVYPLADSLYFNGSWNEATPLYKNLVRKGDAAPLVYYRLAYSLHQAGNQDEALASYYSCLSHNPNPNLIRVTTVNLAKIYSLKNILDSADACLQRAISMGYSNLYDLESSSDFKSFRSSAAYTKIHDQLIHTTFPCVAQPEARWFDFWVGDWKAYQTGTQNLAGISKIEKISGECALLENWTSTNNTFNGKSINFYNTLTSKWEQHWIGSTGGYQKFENGQYKDDAMRFTFTRSNAGGTPSIGKFTFFNISPDQVRQLSESSSDQGKTWTIDYDFTYLRNKDKM